MRGIHLEWTKSDLTDGLDVKCSACHCKVLTTTEWDVQNCLAATIVLPVITLTVTTSLLQVTGQPCIHSCWKPLFPPSSCSVPMLDQTRTVVISPPSQHLVMRLMQKMQQRDILTGAQNVNDTSRLPRDHSPLRYGTLGRLDYPIKMRRCLFSNIFVTAPLQGCSSLHLLN